VVVDKMNLFGKCSRKEDAWNLKNHLIQIRTVNKKGKAIIEMVAFQKQLETFRKKLIERCNRQIKTIKNDKNIEGHIETICRFYPEQMIRYINHIFGVE
jgi:hypothetical protein